MFFSKLADTASRLCLGNAEIATILHQVDFPPSCVVNLSLVIRCIALTLFMGACKQAKFFGIMQIEQWWGSNPILKKDFFQTWSLYSELGVFNQTRAPSTVFDNLAATYSGEMVLRKKRKRKEKVYAVRRVWEASDRPWRPLSALEEQARLIAESWGPE